MRKKTFFWASYADLMSSLFFIMLVLFVLTVVMLQKQMKEIEKMKEATEAEVNKIKEIQNAISNIDSTYFAYNAEHKKHILKIDVGFKTNSAEIMDIAGETRIQLLNAGRAINQFIRDACEKYEAQYLLIIEGHWLWSITGEIMGFISIRNNAR